MPHVGTKWQHMFLLIFLIYRVLIVISYTKLCFLLIRYWCRSHSIINKFKKYVCNWKIMYIYIYSTLRLMLISETINEIRMRPTSITKELKNFYLPLNPNPNTPRKPSFFFSIFYLIRKKNKIYIGKGNTKVPIVNKNCTNKILP